MFTMMYKREKKHVALFLAKGSRDKHRFTFDYCFDFNIKHSDFTLNPDLLIFQVRFVQ